MPSSRFAGKYVIRSEISARASRRALAFGSLARNGLIGVFPAGGADKPGEVARWDGGGVTRAGGAPIGGRRAARRGTRGAGRGPGAPRGGARSVGKRPP